MAAVAGSSLKTRRMEWALHTLRENRRPSLAKAHAFQATAQQRGAVLRFRLLGLLNTALRMHARRASTLVDHACARRARAPVGSASAPTAWRGACASALPQSTRAAARTRAGCRTKTRSRRAAPSPAQVRVL
eukprot:1282202-Pleurochrysis_carterae.AAC.1